MEFALTLPLFVLILFALFDYGWFFMTKSMADIAVARGCRAGAIVDPADGDPQAEALSEMADWADLVVDDCTGSGRCVVTPVGIVPTKRLQCEMSFDFEPIVGLVPTPSTVKAYNTSRLEWQRP